MNLSSRSDEAIGSYQLDDTQPIAPDEKVENCERWAKKILKSAKISKITQEYRELKEWKPSVSVEISEKNMEKNRYRGILCADQNRVILKSRDAENDYINASWMNASDSSIRFISTQGPMKNTVVDFWHMIYTEKCSVIVMLCQFVEDDTEKCFKYFSQDSQKEYGDYRVKVAEKTVDFSEPVKYTQIQVKKKDGKEKHIVHHYWYHNWHDQVAPIDAGPMIKLYKTVVKKCQNSPIVVHCSAGVGRTSTFVGIHLGAEMIRESSSIQMSDILKRLRNVRLGSIQSQLQYVFLLICILNMFVEDKIVKRDAKYDEFLKKYSALTKKVTDAIVQEEERQKKSARKSSRDKDQKKQGQQQQQQPPPQQGASQLPNNMFDEQKTPTRITKSVDAPSACDFGKRKGDEQGKGAFGKNAKLLDAPSICDNTRKTRNSKEKIKDMIKKKTKRSTTNRNNENK